MNTRLTPRFGIAVLLTAMSMSPVLAQDVAEDRLWKDVDDAFLKSTIVDSALDSSAERQIVPKSYRAVELDHELLQSILGQAPRESTTDWAHLQEDSGVVLSLPLPDGSFGKFRIVESPIMEPGLEAKFPEIKTYRGQGIDNPAATVRFDRTPTGFHAMILSPRGSVFIDPYSTRDTRHHISYWKRDYVDSPDDFRCHVTERADSHLVEQYRATRTGGGNGTMLRTYRLAVAATGEYTDFHGGTVGLGQAAIVTAMNRVNGIYEQEVALRMTLVANNDLLVYTDGATDPYTNDDGETMLGQNQTNVDAVIGSANYDIGHVFSTGGGGIASLRVPCANGSKARGVTGLGSPTGDPFWVDFVAHEMGHQWGGNHTFNGDEGSCSGINRNGPTAYEPGSGTTIQAYAGICGSQNIQSNSDAYFHGISLDEIISYSTSGTGNSCPVQTATGNNPPTVDAGAAYTIPLETPFELCGTGSDPDLDPLTFSWEQFDLGQTGHPNSPVGDAPIFRSFTPTASPCRTFPQISDLVADTQTLGEILPTYARTLDFRLTARDNQSGGGGVMDDSTSVDVVDTAGPFRVISPNTSGSLLQGSSQTVAWDVASTDQAPISCATVDITLSSDGGFTYPTSLASGVANSGSRSVTLPNTAIANARIQVRCADNIFFDISDVDFGIGVPEVAINLPIDGATVVRGQPLTFDAAASDPEDGPLSADIVWTSSQDGAIGTGASFAITSLSLGTHIITATVTDSDMSSTSDSVTVYVEPVCAAVLYETGFESDDGGWIDGASTCSTGTFIRGTPDEVVTGATTTQVGGSAGGTFSWFTANNGGGAGVDDVDGGTCETLSPAVNVGAGNLIAVFVDYFHGQRDEADDAGDGFSIVLVEGNTGLELETLVDIGDVTHNAVWTGAWVLRDNAPVSVRLRVQASDGAASGDLVEGGIDNVRICLGLTDDIFTDGFESGDTTVWASAVP